jgi:hypothetical protein
LKLILNKFMKEMKRKEFIKYGSIFTVGALIAGTGSMTAGPKSESFADNNDQSDRRPDPHSFESPVLKAIALGINAPSPHNTQSWKFMVLNDLEMRLYVDEKILLPATDPPARQIHIGAGCFLETMALGASRYGYEMQVEYFPEGYETSADFGVKPVAQIRLVASEKEADPLAQFIEHRQTSRMPYKGKMVERSEFDSIKNESGESYSTVRFIHENLDPYLNVFSKAMEIESKTYASNEETRRMFRFSEDERRAKRDGISIPQMGYKGMIEKLAEKSLKDGDHDTWHSEKNFKATMKGINKGIKSTRGIVFWQTNTNHFNDWLRTGRDYVRFSHSLTKNGYYAHPYNQAIQEYPEMDNLRVELDSILGIKPPQKIQMIVRIGQSAQPYYSYRRGLQQYMM